MEKSAVYGQRVHLDSLITTASKIIDPNNDAPAKYKQKPSFEEKNVFSRFLLGKTAKVL
jgi:hypothetical protein